MVSISFEPQSEPERRALLSSSQPTLYPSFVVPAFSDELYGYILMFLSTIGFSGISTTVHILGSAQYSFGVPSILTLWFRSVIQLVLSLMYITILPSEHLRLSAMTRKRAALLCARGFLGAGSMACVFKALSLLQLGEAVPLLFICPVLSTFLMSITFGEFVSPTEWIMCAISFLGVVLIAHPTFSGAPHTQSRTVGVVLALSSAFFAALAYVAVRKLGKQVHFILNVLSTGLWCFFATTIWLWPTLRPSLEQILVSRPSTTMLLVLQGFFGFFGQCFLNSALQHASGLSIMIRNLDVPLSYVFGLWLGEVPNLQSAVGASMVLAASVAIGFGRIVA